MVEDVLRNLLKGLTEHELPHKVTFEIRFPDADDSDCLVLVMFKDNTLEIHRVMGSGVVKRVFDSPELTEDFFELLRRDYAMVKRTIELRG